MYVCMCKLCYPVVFAYICISKVYKDMYEYSLKGM